MAKIAIVDDSKTDRSAIVGTLKEGGHIFIEYTNGPECLQGVKGSKPDLIILDVIMPGQDGFQVCRTLKRDPDLQAIPVIMLTSKDGQADKFWGMKQGADVYLTKPLAADALKEAVAKFAK